MTPVYIGAIRSARGAGPHRGWVLALVAIGAVPDRFRIWFLDWMLFGIPPSLFMVATAGGLLAWIPGVRARVAVRGDGAKLVRSGWLVVALSTAAVAAWVLEPLHGIPGNGIVGRGGAVCAAVA